MLTDTQSFIRKVKLVEDYLKILSAQAEKEDSQFQWQIKSSLRSIETISKTYDEVLKRDVIDDNPYQPEAN